MASTRLCSIPDCGKPHSAHGYCAKHCYRYRRYGDPLHLVRQPKPAECDVDGCTKPVKQNRLCSTHFMRWYQHGDPLKTLQAAPTERRAFMQDAINSSTDDCINWPYGCNEQGYGVITIDGWKGKVHHYVCKAVHGDRPSHRHGALHSCGNGHLGASTLSISIGERRRKTFGMRFSMAEFPSD